MRIGVLGAGVVGLTSAWWLAEAGHQVILVDRHTSPAAEASAGNGGQLSYNFVSPFASPAMLRKLPGMLLSSANPISVSFDLELIRWGIEFLKSCTHSAVARTVVAQLALGALSRIELEQVTEAQNLDYGLRTAGKLVLYRDAADFTDARTADEGTADEGMACDILTPSECLALEPGLRIGAHEIAGGIYTPSEQVGDCAAFCAQLFARLQMHRNVELRMGEPIKSPRLSGGTLRAIDTDSGTFEADCFVLSLGAGARAFARACGFNLPIYPVKGHSITIDGEAGRIAHSITDYNARIVFAPLQGALRIAGYADFTGYDRTPDDARIASLKTAAENALGIEAPASVSPWAGLRPMTPDSRPIIGPSPVAGLFLNTGQGGLGWTLACGSARLLTDLIDGKEPACPAAPFSVQRYL